MVVGWNLGWHGTWRKAVFTGGGGLVCECPGSVHWKGVYKVGEWTLGGVIFFCLVIKIDQSETTKSHLFNLSFGLANLK